MHMLVCFATLKNCIQHTNVLDDTGYNGNSALFIEFYFINDKKNKVKLIIDVEVAVNNN